MTHYTLKSMLAPYAVFSDLGAKTKEEALLALTAPLAAHGDITGREPIVATLMQREALASCAIAGGIALPHTKSPAVHTACMAFGISRAGIDWKSPDGEKTHLVALGLSHEDPASAYLTLLVELIDKLRIGDIRKKLLACKTDKELYERLLQYDHVFADTSAFLD